MFTALLAFGILLLLVAMVFEVALVIEVVFW